jgi:hypothetical protein
MYLTTQTALGIGIALECKAELQFQYAIILHFFCWQLTIPIVKHKIVDAQVSTPYTVHINGTQFDIEGDLIYPKYKTVSGFVLNNKFHVV